MSEPVSAKTDEAAAAVPTGGLVFRYRNAVPVVLTLLLLGYGALETFLPSLPRPDGRWQPWAGFAVVLAGVLLRLWCILQIGGSARKTSRPKATKVIAWGPYSLVRNPIYIANMTVLAGFTLLALPSWGLPMTLLPAWLWYDAVVRREEAFLDATHGDAFRDYCRFANRWLPRVQYRSRPGEVPPYPFTRALKRERGHLILVGVGLAAAGIVRWILAGTP